jgi:shikimate dehydrogenase
MQVHKLDELKLEAPPGKRLVVLGDPIGHSLSPVMHNAALAKMTESVPDFADWRYEAVHVPATDLKKALPILHEAGVVGINLTIPHKVDVLEIIEEVDETARSMGAVNTLIRTDAGYRGSNTDGYGILKGLEEAHGKSVEDKDIWLFGAGGASRGILVAVLLRELEQGLLARSLNGLERVRFCPLADHPEDADPDAILINATSLGLKMEDPSPIPESFIDSEKVVYDTTYGTSNQLAELCHDRNAPYADGLSMLIWQGVRSLEIWTGEPVPAERMRKAVEDEMNRRKANG